MQPSFRSFAFKLRFDKRAISAVSREEQVARVLRYLRGLGELHPLLSQWYLQGASVREALSRNVLSDPDLLTQAAAASADPEFPAWLSLAVWNGQEDPLQGGLAFIYDAHDMDALAGMDFEDGGALVCALENPAAVFVDMLRLAVGIWPEIDWAVIAPGAYYLDAQVFPDRQTIGWIGFCPHRLQAQDFADAHELIELPGRGTLVVSCAQVMDERNREHARIVGMLDSKLVELGYLPLFNE